MSMRTVLRGAMVVCISLLHVACTMGENWPQWRGPAGTSVTSEKDLPLEWSESDVDANAHRKGIAWRTELPQWGNSTPAIWGDAIFLTSHSGDDLLLLRLDKRTGKIAWTKTVGSGTPARAPIRKKTDEERRSQKFHELHNFASPSPATNGRVVVVHFGNGDLAAYTLAGEQLWKRNLQEDYGPYTIWWGHANSPVIYDDLVISVCMQDSLAGVIDPPSASYVIAHDLKSGEVRWKTMRMTGAKAEECDAYTTPVLRFNLGGAWYPRYPSEAGVPQRNPVAKELIVMGGNQIDAYDPESGKQLWFLPGIVGGRTVTGPTIGNDGVIYATRGMKGALLAVRPGDGGEGRGELQASEDVAWSVEKGTPDSATPVVADGGLFTVTDDGIARCYDANTGEIRWTERIGGKYKASPIATADGRVYFLSMEGKCTVVASAGEKFEKLAENQIEDEFVASPAVSDGRIYLRGRKALYAVGK